MKRRLLRSRRVKAYFELFGRLRGLWMVARELMGDTRCVTTTYKRYSTPLAVRLNSTDILTFRQIFIDKEYDFELKRAPNVIIDAGANIGLATIFFADKFPRARIISIEAEAANFRQLVQNVAGLNNVFPVHAALWNKSGTVKIYDRNTGSAGFSMFDTSKNANSAAEVPSMTINDVMAQFDLTFIDVLKIDIEGAEKEVFADSANWIDKIGVVAAETHDRINMGCRRAFYNATNGFEYEFTKGENLIAMRTPYFSRAPAPRA